MKNIYLFLFALLISLQISAQSNNTIEPKDTADYPYWIEMMQDQSINFFQTQRAFNLYWENRKITKGCGYKPFKRWESFWQTRVNESGEFPAPDQNLIAYQQFFGSTAKQGPLTSIGGSWQELGPIASPTNGTTQPNGLGRVNTVAFHQSNANIIFIGAPSGGLWKTTNGGTSWTNLTDGLPSLGVSSIVLPTNNDTILIGTGDRDAGDAPGIGVYKSIDGGITWNASNTGMGNVTVGKMIMHPSNHNIILAATSGGIYKTTNGGNSWTRTSSNTSHYKDIVFKPGDPSIVYAVINNYFYRSTNTGDSWTSVTSGLPGSSRYVIGVTPANANYVYIAAGSSSGLTGIYRSTNSGASFSTQATSPNILGYAADGSDNSSQAYYDLCIAVDPNNANTLYVGGINIWKSTNGGTSWSINAHWVGSGAPSVHADHHWLGFNPVNDRLYNGNDGGIYYTANGGSSWIDISSGLAIAQVYKLGQSATSKNLVINGYQDNGTSVYRSGSWSTEIGGDGMECLVDHTDTSYMYGALYYGDIRRSTNSGTSFYKIADDGTNGINESGAWVTPYTLNSTNSNIMYIGYKNVWRSTNVKTSSTSSVAWTKISTFGTSSNLSDIESSPADANILYVSRGSSLFRSDNVNASSPSWTTLSAPANISDIQAHPTNSNIVYITAGTNIYKSTNKGSTWTSIKGNLPNTSMNTLIIDKVANEGIYVGTDIGVFYKDASMSQWISFSSGLPAAAEVTELEIFYASNHNQSVLRAATYGRGMWSSDLYFIPNAPPTADFTASNTSPCLGQQIIFTDQSSNTPTTWQWSISPTTYSFASGSNASSQNPALSFTASGNYTITLISGNSYGSDTIIKTNYINVGTPASTPFTENFESFTTGNPGTFTNGWTFSNTGAFNWRANSGGTNTTLSGPSFDHTTGGSTGKYLYTEASSPAIQGEETNLISPCISIPSSGPIQLSFWYHMYGSDITALNVDIFSNGAWINNLYTIIGQQQTSSNSSWLKATVPLNAYSGQTIQLRFRVVRGSSYDGDVAIDDISIAPPPTPVVDFAASATNTYTNTTVSFADLTLNTPSSWTWSFSPSTVNFMNSTTASSQNPQVQFTAAGYYSVTLIATNANGSDTLTKSNYITVAAGQSLPFSENFQTFTVGTPGSLANGWTTNITGNFPWTVDNNGTPSNYTGPSVDHTLGTAQGVYMFTEATSAASGNVAELITPVLDLGSVSNAELKFWYHMYGLGISALNVDIYTNTWTTIYTITGQQQTSNNAAWALASVNLQSYVGNAVKIRFRVVASGDYRSDVAIDDVSVQEVVGPPNDDPCGATTLSVNQSCTYTTGNNLNATNTTGIPIPACGGYQGNDVWFKFIAPISGTALIDAEQVTGSFADGAMAAYKGSCTNLTYLDCEDDYNGSGNMPYMSLSGLTPGDTIFIRFWKYGGNGTGYFQLCVTEGPYIVITPTSKTVSHNLGSTTFQVSSNQNWTAIDNVSWATVSPSSGSGNGTLTVNYSNNSGGSRNATITVSNGSGISQTATLIQNSNVVASFSTANTFLCKNTNTSFTNNSTNNSTNAWYVDGSLLSTSSSFSHSFSSIGTHAVKLVVSNGTNTDSSTQVLYVSEPPTANAGSDTSLCAGGDIGLYGTPTIGIVTCSSSCNMPNYCSSASSNDNFEHIRKVEINGSENQSTNVGNGYENYSSNLFTLLSKDSSYTISITGFVTGATAYTEYVDVFIDWNRNGLFDEPAVSLGSYLFTGAHVFSGTVTVPSSAVLGKTKMRVILKYNGMIASGCENGYGYGETEDYMIEVVGMGAPTYSWTGPSSYTSSNINNTLNNVNTANGGTYTFTVTDAIGCSDSDNKTVTVNAIPNVSFAAISSLCVDASAISLTQGSPSGGTYWGPGVSAGSFNPATAGFGTHTLYYAVVNGNGCGDTATQTVTVHSLPSVSLNTPSALCANSGSITLSGGSPSGGSYSGSGVSGSVFSPALAGTGTKTITYSYSDGNGCSNTAQSTITVNAVTAASFTNPADVCSNGGSISLTGGSPSGGTYSGTGVSNGMFNPASVGAGTHSLNYIYTNSNACSDTAYASITVVNPPSASLSNFADVCDQSAPVSLSGGSPTGGSYFGTGVTSGSFNPNVGPGTYTISYVVSNSSSCSDTATATIHVNALPTLNILNLPASICENGTPVTLNASPAGGTFSGTGISGNTFNPVTAGVGVKSISYTYTDANSCSNSVSQNISVQAAPNVNAGTDDTVNYSTSAQLTGLVSGGGNLNYTWSPASMVLSPTALSTQTVGLTSTQIFTLTATNSTTSCSDSDQVTIYISGGPLSLNISSSATQLCQGDSLLLQALSGGGSGTYSYNWSLNGSPLGTQASLVLMPQNGGYYVVKLEDGINTLYDSVLVTVHALPSVNLGGFQSLCEGSNSINLSGGVPTGGSYSGPGVNNNTFSAITAGVGNHSITYSYTDNNGCSNSASSVLTVHANPNATLSNFPTLCESSMTVALTQGSPLGGSYSGPGVSSNSFNPSVAGVGQHSILYIYTDNHQCKDTVAGLLTVQSSPQANAGLDQTINANSSASLSGSATGGSNSYNYNWSPANKVLNSGSQNTSTVALSTTTEFTLYVNDALSSCSDSDKVLVIVTGTPLGGTLSSNQTAICLGDSIQLTALISGGSGSYTYSWTNASASTFSTIYNPVYQPTVSEWLHLEVYDGSNYFFDSLYIQVSPLPVVNLGPDTLVCGGGMISLNAGNNGSNYLWSDNSTNQVLNINLANLPVGNNLFHVIVSSAGSCAASDSIVITKGNIPYVNLGLDDSICHNQFKILDAGYGFNSYQWNTGDSTQIIQVDGANLGVGLHPIAVQVSTLEGCTNSDTMMLKVVQCNNISEVNNPYEILVFPNPGDGQFTLRIEGAQKDELQLDVLDLQGKLIHQQKIWVGGIQSDFQLNLKDQPKGVYFLRLYNDQMLRLERIIIQ